MSRLLQDHFQTQADATLDDYVYANDVDLLCRNPRNRPKLIQLAVDKANGNPGSIPAEHAADPRAYFQTLTTQAICTFLSNGREFLLATSQVQQAPVLIPMLYLPNGKYYDFADVVQLHKRGARVEQTETGVVLHGYRNVLLMDNALKRRDAELDRMELDWLIDTATDEGKALAHEWGHQTFEPEAWADALQGMEDTGVQSSQLFQWSEGHRPENLDATPQAIVQTARFQQQSSQAQNNVWPTPVLDENDNPIPGQYVLPMDVQSAMDVLGSFDPALISLEGDELVPLDVLNGFLLDSDVLARYDAGNAAASQDRFTQEVVMVYMWHKCQQQALRNVVNMTEEQAKSTLEARGLLELVKPYFLSGGRASSWLCYVSALVISPVSVNFNNVDDPRVQMLIGVVQSRPHLIGQIDDPEPVIQLAAVQADPSVIEQLYQPHASAQMAAVRSQPELVRDIRPSSAITEEVALAAVEAQGDLIYYIENPSERVQLAAVRQYGEGIMSIFDDGIYPSEAVRRAALEQNPSLRSDIENMTQEMANINAVRRNAHAINHIPNPSPAVQMAAVQHQGTAIASIANPSPAVRMAAVRSDGSVMYHVLQNLNPSPELVVAAVQENWTAQDAVMSCMQTLPSEEVQLAVVQQDGHNLGRLIEVAQGDGVEISEAVKKAAVQKNGMAIKHLIEAGLRPSEDVQLAAVQYHGSALEYIVKAGIVPSPELELAAVTQNGSAIQYVRRPSYRMKMLALQTAAHAIQYFRHPTREMQLQAVRRDAGTIYYIDSPSEEVQLAAVEQDPMEAMLGLQEKGVRPSALVQRRAVLENPRAIKHIDNPVEEAQMIAVRQDGYVVHKIQNPSLAVQVAAVQQDVDVISDMRRPSLEVQMAAVRADGRSIRGIWGDPSPAVQLAAVLQNPEAIQYIDNPSPEAQLATVRQNPEAIQYIDNPSPEAQAAAQPRQT